MVLSGTQIASTTKTGRHDIAEISLKVALNTINQNQSNQIIEGRKIAYSFNDELLELNG